MTAGQLAGGLFADSALGWQGAFAMMAIGFGCMGALLYWRAPRPPQAPNAEAGARPSFAQQIGTVLREPWARVVLLAVGAEGMFLLSPLAYLPAYLHDTKGISLTRASGMLAFYAIGGLAYALSARRIVQALGERRMVLAGGVVAGACFFAWWLAPPWFVSGLLAFVLGFGTYLYHNTLQTHATQMAPTARGTAVSLFSLALFGSQAIGVAITAWTLDGLGWSPMLLIAAVAMPLVGLAFSVALGRHEATAMEKGR
jgi:predicted MFS family arabinose efflux permease